MRRISVRHGSMLIEVVIGSAIILFTFLSIGGAYLFYLRAARLHTPMLQARLLLEENSEAVRVLRDRGWGAVIAPLTPENVYYLAWSSGRWEVTTTPQFFDGTFERSVIFHQAYRDAQNMLATSGTVDGSVRRVTVRVAWREQTATTSIATEFFIHNL